MLRYRVIAPESGLHPWQAACVRLLAESGMAKPARDDDCPDFFLLFGPRESARDFIDRARYGTWYFTHGGFWDMFANRNVTRALLVKITGPDTGVVLKSAHLSTIRESLQKNLAQVVAAMQDWPARVCDDIQSDVDGYFSEPPVQLPAQYDEVPDKYQLLYTRLLEIKNRCARFFEREFFREDWHIARMSGSLADVIGQDVRAQLADVFPHQNGVYLADPCVFAHQGRTAILCEEFSYDSFLGRIVVFDERDCDSPAYPVITEPYHLSYPHIFEHEGQVYCIPESSAASGVRLYRAAEFPRRWEYVRTLIEGVSMMDSTLLRFGAKWWLFCTSGDAANKTYNSHLSIWYADDLDGPWLPHRSNPVKIDVRSARPAGSFVAHDGALFRPAQDCSRTYGGAIAINRIDTLTPAEFKETVVGILRPPRGRYNKGIHTIGSAGDYCVVDVKRSAFYAGGIIAVLKRTLKAAALKAGVPSSAFPGRGISSPAAPRPKAPDS